MVKNRCVTPGQMVLIASAASPPIFSGSSTNTLQVRMIPSFPDLIVQEPQDILGSMQDGL